MFLEHLTPRAKNTSEEKKKSNQTTAFDTAFLLTNLQQ